MWAALHIMSYLKVKHNLSLVLGPNYASINYQKFKSDHDWIKFYGGVKEAMPLNVPKPLQKEVELRKFVGYDLAGDKAVCRSHTRFVIFMNVSMIN